MPERCVWFKTYTDFFDHPKTDLAARLLEIDDRDCLSSKIQRLFRFAALHHRDGEFSDVTDRRLEMECRWFGEPGKFLQVLCDVGFIEPSEEDGRSWRIHNWSAYTGSWGSAARVAKHRAKKQAEEQERQQNDNADPCNVTVTGCNESLLSLRQSAAIAVSSSASESAPQMCAGGFSPDHKFSDGPPPAAPVVPPKEQTPPNQATYVPPMPVAEIEKIEDELTRPLPVVAPRFRTDTQADIEAKAEAAFAATEERRVQEYRVLVHLLEKANLKDCHTGLSHKTQQVLKRCLPCSVDELTEAMRMATKAAGKENFGAGLVAWKLAQVAHDRERVDQMFEAAASYRQSYGPMAMADRSSKKAAAAIDETLRMMTEKGC